MRAINESYFDPQLCMDGHYIITGNTNDVFYDPQLERTDIKYELYRCLKHVQGFDAVVFLDRENSLFCYDDESFAILKGGNEKGQDTGRIIDNTPLGHRSNKSNAPQVERRDDLLCMPRQEYSIYWSMLIKMLKDKEHRCALILPNADSVIGTMTDMEVQALEELGYSGGSASKSIVIYVFRETNICTLRDSVEKSAAMSPVWARIAGNILLPRITGDNDRVIELSTPKEGEIRNFLNAQRLFGNKSVKPWEIESLAKRLYDHAAIKGMDMKSLEYMFMKAAGQSLETLSFDEKSALEKLDELVGLTGLKKDIRNWMILQDKRGKISRTDITGTDFLRVNCKELNKDTNQSRLDPCEAADNNAGHAMNCIMKGNPGTGKTTVAALMGQLYFELGLLSKGHLVVRSAAQLLGGWAGQSARNVHEAVSQAIDGVLFIDEAYSLCDSQHGGEAITQLVNDMSLYEGRFAVVMAGYGAKMERLIKSNEGLARRFGSVYNLSDYSADELSDIFMGMVRKDDDKVSLDDELEKNLTGIWQVLLDTRVLGKRSDKAGKWGNAGEAQKLLLEMKKNAAMRDRRTGGFELTMDDLPERVRAAYNRYKNEAAKKGGSEDLFGKEEIKDYIDEILMSPGKEGFHGVEGMHFSIEGNVGCGKKTCVKAIARALKKTGALDSESVIVAGNADLEAGYVGQTAIKTADLIERALGGVLIIENPSSLILKNVHDNGFGPEALGVIENAMTDHGEDLCIVFADTKSGMEAFFKAFPSVRGRLSREFEIQDLKPDQMERIFDIKAENEMVFSSDIRDLKGDFFINWVTDRGGLGDSLRSWGNGNETEKLIRELLGRWKSMKGVYEGNRKLITREMFPSKYGRYLYESRARAETALRELEDLTGLKSVKESVKRIERRLRMMPGEDKYPGLYCYLGNPGVGKTKVAYLMGGILRSVGALSLGHVVVRTARQLGASMDEFDDVIRLAANGILFIDEAHQLGEQDNIWGRSVIKKLLTVLEDTTVTKNTCIILAGYPQEMRNLLTMDGGLSSRFGSTGSIIEFKDYTPDELLLIMDGMCERAADIVQIGADRAITCSEDFRKESLEMFKSVTSLGDVNYGNARFVRNYLHDTLDECLKRMDADGKTVEDGLKFDVSDIPEVYVKLKDRQKGDEKFDSSKVSCENRDIKDTERLSRGVILIESEYVDGNKGEGTGFIITREGYALTCAHVVKGAKNLRVRIYSKGMPGGDFRWLFAKVIKWQEECDMALIKLEGGGFDTLTLRQKGEKIEIPGKTLLPGFPLGKMLSGNDSNVLNLSFFKGSVASVQKVGKKVVYYIDSTGLHGNSGSPVISQEDGRVMGIFSGSIAPGGLDEINMFHPIDYFWEKLA